MSNVVKFYFVRATYFGFMFIFSISKLSRFVKLLNPVSNYLNQSMEMKRIEKNVCPISKLM